MKTIEIINLFGSASLTEQPLCHLLTIIAMFLLAHRCGNRT
jgi:hypothetical protein